MREGLDGLDVFASFKNSLELILKANRVRRIPIQLKKAENVEELSQAVSEHLKRSRRPSRPWRFIHSYLLLLQFRWSDLLGIVSNHLNVEVGCVFSSYKMLQGAYPVAEQILASLSADSPFFTLLRDMLLGIAKAKNNYLIESKLLLDRIDEDLTDLSRIVSKELYLWTASFRIYLEALVNSKEGFARRSIEEYNLALINALKSGNLLVAFFCALDLFDMYSKAKNVTRMISLQELLSSFHLSQWSSLFDIADLVMRSRIEYFRGNLEQALALALDFVRLVESQAFHGLVVAGRLMLAEILITMRRPREECIKALDGVVEEIRTSGIENSFAYLDAIDLYSLLGETEKATDLLNILENSFRQAEIPDIRLLESKGLLEMAKGNLDSAQFHFNKVITIASTGEENDLGFRSFSLLLIIYLKRYIVTRIQSLLTNAIGTIGPLLRQLIDQGASELVDMLTLANLVLSNVLDDCPALSDVTIRAWLDGLTYLSKDLIKMIGPQIHRLFNEKTTESLGDLNPVVRVHFINDFLINHLLPKLTIPANNQESPVSPPSLIILMTVTGVTIHHLDWKFKAPSDPALIGGFISAISEFSKEVVSDSQGSLRSIQHEEYIILLEKDPNSPLIAAAVAAKESFLIRERLRLLLSRVRNLTNWDSQIFDFSPEQIKFIERAMKETFADFT